MRNPDKPDWWLYYIVLIQEEGSVAVGTAGFKGPPDADGVVEIGYGVLPEYQRLAITTEVSRGLLLKAFSEPQNKCVISETLSELSVLIGVMEKCGFRLIGEGSEEGVIRCNLVDIVNIIELVSGNKA